MIEKISAAREENSGLTRSPTVFDVARDVGCSIATVSRALNQPGRVGPDIRMRVLEAVSRLGYVPNGSARALRSSRTRLFGAVIPTLNQAIYARLIESLQHHLAGRGVSLLHVTDGYDLNVEEQQVRLLLEHGVEGVVLVGARHRAETFALLRDRDVPFITTYAVARDADIPFVGFDNKKAGSAAARYLIDLGHRRLGMIAGITQNNDRAAERVDGFLQSVREAGLVKDDIIVIEAPYRMDSGEAALRIMLDKRLDITAIFCGSDILAVGAIRHCRSRGIMVPEELSVIGFDDLEVAEYLYPPLTTIAVPAEAMGKRAAEFLLTPPPDRPLHAHTELETQLVVRETSGPPPGSPRRQSSRRSA